MENKINIAELLKDCPSGMELDCTMYENVYFDKIYDEDCLYQIGCYTINDGVRNSIYFTKYGKFNTTRIAKCVIFPKGKTTWEGFQRPFKNEDIVATQNGIWIGIHKRMVGNAHEVYFAINHDCLIYNDNIFCFERLATEEEKEKLFNVIKANGYKWNEETKTLEKLEDIEDKGNISDGYHTFNELYEYRLLYNASMFNELAKQGLYDVHKSKLHSDGTIPFGDDDWFIVQAELPTGQISNHYEMKDWDLFQVPIKEKANQYDGHTPQDVAKRLRDFLTIEKLVEPKFKVGDKITKIDGSRKGEIYYTDVDKYHVYVGNYTAIDVFFEDQDNWELVPNKFDITTLKPFDKVLVRQDVYEKWGINFFGFYNYDEGYYYTTGNWMYKQCIPYEGNEYLLGTTDNCDNFYKTW